MNAQPRTWMQQLRSKRDARYTARIRHDERFDTLRRARVRQGLVAVSLLLWLGASALLWWGFPTAFLVVALLALGSAVLVNRAVRLVADAPEQVLDERLVAVRNAAYRTSYRVVAAVTALVLFAVSIAVDERFGWAAFELEGHHVRTLLWGFVGLAVLMPTAVLAWREREV